MKKLVRLTLIMSIIGVLISAISCSQNSTGADAAIGAVTDYRPVENRTLEKGAPAPDFQFETTGGQTTLLSDLKGKVVILNFWSVDCPYCVKEMPLLEQAHKDWQSEGLIVIAINTGESRSKVAGFASGRNLTFDIVLDPDLYVSTVYQAHYLPTTYIIDKTGNIVSGKIGAFANTAEIITAIRPYLQ